MSTKTSFKRIALVAVAALGLGTLSSLAPASAAVYGDTNTVDYASTSVELGQDAVLVLHQQFLATGAANSDTQTVTFTVTQNAFTTSTANTASPTVFLGSTAGTVSTGTTSQVARGYAADAVYGGFPAADIAAGSVNANNTQAGGGTGASVTVTNQNSASGASSLLTVRGFQRVEWNPTIVGTYSLTVKTYPKASPTSSDVASNTYVWTFSVVAAGTASAAAAKLLTVSSSYSTSTLGYGYATCITVVVCDAYGPWYNRTSGYPTDTIYATDSLAGGTSNFLGTGLEAAGSLVTVNATTSVASTLVPVTGATIWAEITEGPGVLQLRDNSSANNLSLIHISEPTRH